MRRFGKIKGFEFRKCFEASYCFYYVSRGRDSSYFGFIPTFRLNWDCFEVDFRLSLERFLCHVMARFFGFNLDGFVADFVVLLRTGLGHV